MPMITKYSFKSVCIRVAPWIALAAICACSTVPGKNKPSPDTSSKNGPQKPVFSPVTFAHAISPAGDLLRDFGEQTSGGFVLMSGLEERAIPAVDFRNKAYEQVMAHIAEALGCTYKATPYYFILLPSEYKLLENVSFSEKMNETYGNFTASAVFGAKTELFIVFAVLSESLGLTIVADNFIAETHCGELHLPEAPLHVVLEAIIQSARISPDTLVLESTPEYLFLHATRNESETSLCHDATALTAEQQALLDRPVSLSLPGIPGEGKEDVIFAFQPIPLGDALFPLTEQLGIEVVAQRRLRNIPVNPIIFKNVRLQTALDLLIRQWPVTGFTWELQANRILIRER